MAKMGTCSELDETKTSKKKNQQKNGPYFSPFPLNYDLNVKAQKH